ncbi:MAG: hypothetical protein ACXWFS_01570 [Thermoanaerobaculia bacterium]
MTKRRRRKTRPTARLKKKHTVKAHFNVPQLTKAGSSLSLEVYADEQKIGEVTIGRGSLFWRGGRRHLLKKISWSRFAEKMDELAYG